MDEIKLFDFIIWRGTSFLNLVVHLLMNLVFVTILVQKIYLTANRNRDYLLILYTFNVLVFFLGSLFSHVVLQTGFAFGLFALFSIIRYRTQQVPIKEMTYLFAVIIMATLNSTVTSALSYAEIFLADITILLVIGILERNWLKFYRRNKLVIYEKIELIVPERRQELIADLGARTGLRVFRANVVSVNFLRDTAEIQMFYEDDDDRPGYG